MTKEEFIAKVLENRREGKTPICYDVLCRECPYKANVKCDWEELRDDLIDYIIEIGDLLHEKQKETNLEHYLYVSYLDDKLCDVEFKKCYQEGFEESKAHDFKKWLLAPYEEPKYRLTQFEYDFVWSLGKAFFG